MQKSTIGLVLQDNIIVISVWTWLFWGGCPNADLLHSLEVLHCRVARIIYNLPRPSRAIQRQVDPLTDKSSSQCIADFYKEKTMN